MPDRSRFRAKLESGAMVAGRGGITSSIPTGNLMLVSSLTRGASLGLTKVVDDRMAASLMSSYRLGGYSESEVEMSRLMLIRRGDGASGGLDVLLDVSSVSAPADTKTNGLC